jgi:hypothetical protein
MFASSFINFDNNNRLPFIRLSFFDILGNNVNPEAGWMYSCILSIPDGAKKSYSFDNKILNN